MQLENNYLIQCNRYQLSNFVILLLKLQGAVYVSAQCMWFSEHMNAFFLASCFYSVVFLIYSYKYCIY